MERQLANLTGLVQKALTQNVPGVPVTVVGANINQNYLGVPGQYRGGMYFFSFIFNAITVHVE